MYVLGLQGSPRKKGNTSLLLSAYLEEAERRGAHIKYLEVVKKNISGCKECGTCEKKGYCPIDDDMQKIYPLLRRADIVVMATPVFFYGPTAQLKALIDRSQALWARKYTHGLTDPGRKWRRGFVISVGATKGKNLFEGVNLTAKYFFDAVGADFAGSLAYSRIEGAGDIKNHPTALADAAREAKELVDPFLKRKKILFVCTENACRSQMASAFARFYAGDRIEAESAGSEPADKINPVMEKVMGEKGIDMAYRRPKSLDQIDPGWKPDLIVSMGCEDACPLFPGVPNEEWDLEDPAEKPVEFMREIRDRVEKKVKELIAGLD